MPDFWSVPPIFGGKPVVIIGSGHSLSLVDIRRVAIARADDRCRVIAVNDAIYVAWFADWLHGSDFKWWNWHKQAATRFPGIRTTINETVPAGWAKCLRSTGPVGFDPDPGCIRHGSNSVFQAMHAAVHAGASAQYLLGVDMRREKEDPDKPLDGQKDLGRSHYFGEHQDGIHPIYRVTMAPRFAERPKVNDTETGPSLYDVLRERKIPVFNCTRGSALKTFPYADLESLL